MSAKDALDRLNRRHKIELRVTAFRPDDYARETINLPPDGKPQVVCHLYPECFCGDDCPNRVAESLVARRILFGLMIAVAVIGTGLVIAGLS
jgi:hypothetical protein